MTPAEAKDIADRANRVTRADEKLKRAREKLDLARKYASGKTVWRPTLKLAEGSNAYNPVTIEITIPGGWIIQQVLDEVKAAEREYILAGGTL